MLPPTPPDEADRLRALHGLAVLDTPPEEEFDQIVALASRICEVPVSLVSLVDAERQWFKARIGLDVTETSRDLSFCAYAILGRDLLVVPDVRSDPRFADNPATRGEPGVRFYAGAPLVTTDGYALGTLCVVDARPRRLKLEQLQALRALARQVTAQFELRHQAVALTRAAAGGYAAERRIGDFITLVCGELRAPLAEVRAYFDQLTAHGEVEPEQAERAAAAARQHASALGRLVDDLIDVADHNAGTGLSMREIDLSRLAAHAVEAVRPIANAKRVWILNTPGPDLPIQADPIRLGQALMHLLFAAVKYTPEGGRVRVTTEAEAGPSLWLDDLETPDGDRPNLFEHFYRSAISRPPSPHGADGGLAVTKQILDVHHATVALADRPGAGTSLHLVFPGYDAAAGSAG
jgi:signal transduction histidine kinase